MIIAIIMLFCICVCLIIALCKKVDLDKETKEINENLAQENTELLIQKQVIENDIEKATNTQQHLSDSIDKLREKMVNTMDQNEEISNKAFENYLQTLENKYKQCEYEFDDARAALLVQLDEVREELDKLKATRAAAHEALLKEQEIKDNKDNYRLMPSESDLADSRRLELVKKELNKPRILCMLIWQTYWQPIAKKQFPQIIQSKTKCGIYKITNIVTNECYIGQSVDIYKRWCDHCKCGLGIDTPPGNKLYKAIQQYGLDNFTFEVLDECSSIELNTKEKYFIELYQADTFGYNGNTGVNK